MSTIIETLESGIGDLVYFSNAYTEHYGIYISEANKPSKEYNHATAQAAFDRAKSYAKMTINTAKDLGLNPEKVCRDCVHFMEAYKEAA